jgi:DNA modification methylase
MSNDTVASPTVIPLLNIPEDTSKYKVNGFSASNFHHSDARQHIEDLYHPLLEISSTINRRSVSFQLSKKARIHGWLKYKEGFSASLVDTLLDDFGVKAGSTVLDPFLGSGTTSLVAQIRGINSVGYDILPTSKIAISAKQNILSYDLGELKAMRLALDKIKVPSKYSGRINSIPITEGAYPEDTDRTLAYILYWLNHNLFSSEANNLLLLCMVNSLERLSYTNKDGQYLRWDYRSIKVTEGNRKRAEKGLEPFKTILDKGELPKAVDVIASEFDTMLTDIEHVQENRSSDVSAKLEFIEDTVLKQLPMLKGKSIDAVITSPPYCNRYDYTRTYALELAFLGLDNDAVKELRQKLLSATVENRSKLTELEAFYKTINRLGDYKRITKVITECEALQETITALKARAKNGEINNNGVLRMVEGYFTELTFVYAELFRVCKPGASVAFVNDNVRYGGEIISVDYISTALAEALGFKPIKIISLKQQKGNSSQQMKKYGRAPLRKSITVWQKP